jgi:predicted RNase H-like HicB family nuclease
MQNTYRYPALFEACEEGGYTVTFPDLPGIVTEGDTIDEAIAMAKEALALHILGMERDGDVFPSATNPATLPPLEGSFYSLVEAYLPPLRDKRANRSVNKMVTLPAWLKEEADRHNLNVSQILQRSLMEQLGIQSSITLEKSKSVRKHQKNDEGKNKPISAI